MEDCFARYIDTATSTNARLTTENSVLQRSGVTILSWLVKRSRKFEHPSCHRIVIVRSSPTPLQTHPLKHSVEVAHRQSHYQHRSRNTTNHHYKQQLCAVSSCVSSQGVVFSARFLSFSPVRVFSHEAESRERIRSCCEAEV